MDCVSGTEQIRIAESEQVDRNFVEGMQDPQQILTKLWGIRNVSLNLYHAILMMYEEKSSFYGSYRYPDKRFFFFSVKVNGLKGSKLQTNLSPSSKVKGNDSVGRNTKATTSADSTKLWNGDLETYLNQQETPEIRESMVQKLTYDCECEDQPMERPAWAACFSNWSQNSA